MALLMAYYNFLRPHAALKFGKTVTPAMQAGLATKCLSFRELFTSEAALFLFLMIMVLIRNCRLDFKPVSTQRSESATTLI
jgi:hypothetical protein